MRSKADEILWICFIPQYVNDYDNVPKPVGYHWQSLAINTLRAKCTNMDNRRIKLIHGLSEDLLDFGMLQARLSSTTD